MSFDMENAVAEIGGDLFPGAEDGGAETVDTTTELTDKEAEEYGGDPATKSTELAAKPPAEGETTPPAATETPATPPVTAPRTWRPEAQAEWDKLPPTVQAEVLKREEDMFKGLEGYKADATAGKAYQQVFAPYQQIIEQSGADPLVMTQNFLEAHAALTLGTPEQKQETLSRIAQMYGVVMPAAAGPDGEAPYVDPQVAALQQQLAAVQSRLAQQDQQQQAAAARQQQEVRSKLQAEIDAFAADPAHKYFDQVANDIAAQIKAGAKDLAEAYERAVWANPATRALEQQRLAEEAATKAQKEAAERAAAARKATSANVRTSANNASGTTPLGSIDDTLKSAYRKFTEGQ